MARDIDTVNDLCPREAVVMQGKLHSLVQDTKATFSLLVQCQQDKGRLYKEQLKKMREISNASTRNALTVSVYIYIVLLYIFGDGLCTHNMNENSSRLCVCTSAP